MTDRSRVTEELWILAAAVCEGTLNEADQPRLDELLADDQAARLYSEYCNLHCDLHFRASANRAADEVLAQIDAEVDEKAGGKRQEAGVGSQESAEAAPSSAPHSSFLTPHSSSSSRPWLRTHITRKSIATAVTVLAAAIAVMAVLPVSDVAPKKKEKEVAKEGAKIESVARLVHSADAVWSGDIQQPLAVGGTRRVERGMRLFPGEKLFLASGMAEFKFFNGAEVVLEGPAEFEVQGRKQCGLTGGKLVARATEERSKGFVVEVPTGRVEDLGTEFGVEVLPAGNARVAVFDGHVALMAEGQTVAEGVQLAKDEEAELLPNGEVVRSQTGFAKRFVRTVPTFGKSDLGEYGEAVLADKPVAYWPLSESYGRVVRDAAGAHNGWYRGSARRINDGDRRFARFDANGGLLEVPHDAQLNTPEFSIELWLRVDPTHTSHGTLVTTRYEQGGLFGYVFYAVDNRITLMTGQGPGKQWMHLDSPEIESGRWTHVVATYKKTEESAEGTARLYIDGKLVAAGDTHRYAPNRVASLAMGASPPLNNNPKYRLLGDLAHVAIYDRPLAALDIERHAAAWQRQADTKEKAKENEK